MAQNCEAILCVIIFSLFLTAYSIPRNEGTNAQLPRCVLEASFTADAHITMPVIGDIDADGTPEIVFGTGSGELQVIRKTPNNGFQILWTRRLGSLVHTPALGDINNDNIAEIVVYVSELGSADGSVYALEPDGTILWRRPVMEYGMTEKTELNYPKTNSGCAIALGSLNSDGYYGDIAFVAPNGELYALSAFDGRVLWHKSLVFGASSGPYDGEVAILDIDLDYKNELVVLVTDLSTGNSAVSIYRHDGTLWYSVQSGKKFALADFDLDEKPELVVSNFSGTQLRRYDGKLLQYFSEPSTELALADLNSDYRPEIIIGTASSTTAVQRDGTILWHIPGSDVKSLGVFDMNGDGNRDVIISSMNGLFIANGTNGKCVDEIHFTFSSTPHPLLIADVDADGHAELILSAGRDLQVFGNDVLWARTRITWNQLTYSPLDVDDELGLGTEWRMGWRDAKATNNWRTQEPFYNTGCRRLSVSVTVNPSVVYQGCPAWITVVPSGSALPADFYFDCPLGHVSPNPVPNQSGTFTVAFTVDYVSKPTTAVVTVRAKAINTCWYGEQSFSGSTHIVVIPPPIRVVPDADPSTICWHENSSLTIYVRNGSDPLPGAEVTLTATNGGIITPSSGISDIFGEFKATFSRPVPINTPVVCTITARGSKQGYGWMEASTDVTVTPCTLSVEVAPKPPLIYSGDTSTVQVTVVNKHKAPVESAALNLTVTFGTLSSADGNTDTGGKFITTYRAPSLNSTQICNVTAKGTKNGYYENSGYGKIKVIPKPVAPPPPPVPPPPPPPPVPPPPNLPVLLPETVPVELPLTQPLMEPVYQPVLTSVVTPTLMLTMLGQTLTTTVAVGTPIGTLTAIGIIERQRIKRKMKAMGVGIRREPGEIPKTIGD